MPLFADSGSSESTAPTDLLAALPLTALDRAFAGFLQQAQPSEDVRHALLAALTSHQYCRGHACLDLAQLQQGVALLGWDAAQQALLPADLGAVHTLPWATGDASPLVLQGRRLYLRRNWEAEQAISAALAARLQQDVQPPAGLARLLERLFDGAPETPDWQKLACALAARKRFTLITGGPGTGKTTTVVRLLALLQAAAPAPLRLALAAPTGKAAARLGDSIASALAQLPEDLRPGAVPQAQTLHKLLQVRPDRPELPAPALAVDLVIVDEASMIDLEMMARLLQAVPLSASLVLLGDKDQLASVEAGAVMAQLCEGAEAGGYDAATVQWLQQVAACDVRAWAASGMPRPLAQQTVMLRHSRRFRDDSGIGIWARAVNGGDVGLVRTLWQQAPVLAQGDVAGREGDANAVQRLQTSRPQDPAFSALLQRGWAGWLQQLQHMTQPEHGPCSDTQALQALQAFAQLQVLCAVREGPWGVDALNARIAAALGLPLEGWYAGRPVMVQRNDYNLGLMNGDVGLCLPHARGLRVAFADGQGGVRWVSPQRLEAVHSVFAMTVHKSQGSEFTQVCLVLPAQAVPVLTRELLYTGITRARQRLYLVLAEPEVLWHAVQAQVIRSGGLGPKSLGEMP